MTKESANHGTSCGVKRGTVTHVSVSHVTRHDKSSLQLHHGYASARVSDGTQQQGSLGVIR